MLKRMTVAALAVLAGVAGAHAQNQTEVVIQYPYPELFTETHKKIAEEFAKVRPDIKVTMRAPYESYEDGTQRVLREAVTSQMPDVSFQGLNRIRVLVDKNIPAPLDGYIAEEKDFDKQGFHQAMFDIGTSSGKSTRCRSRFRCRSSMSISTSPKRPAPIRKTCRRPGTASSISPGRSRPARPTSTASPTHGTSPETGCGRRRYSPAAARC